MRYAFFLIFLFSLTCQADEKSALAIAKIQQKVSSTSAYRVDFTTKDMKGVLTVSGDKYTLIADNIEVYYDGATLWNFNKKSCEVNVESLTPNKVNVMTNPSKLLAVSDYEFSHKTIAPNTIELTPKDSKSPYRKIVIEINSTTSLPEKAVILDSNSGEQITIFMSKFTPDIKVSPDTFRFNPSKHKGVDVIDFR